MSQYFTHPVPAVVVLLGLLVFFHELGHFLVGRWCGIAVETFSIGFGPRIFGFTHSGTEYRVGWIPLGGFVKFAGSHPSEDLPSGLKGQAFLQTSLPKRALTVLAGPLSNFLLAVVVYSVLGFDGVPHPPALIGDVIEGSAAAAAGIKYGDKIESIGGREVQTWRHLEEAISSSPGKKLAIIVSRGGQRLSLELVPELVHTSDMLGRPASIGRAGVALGRQPAIVSVLAANSAAAQAGLKTGDRVLEITVQGADGKPIPSQHVDFYPELVDALRRAAATNAAVSLTIAAAPLPEDRGELKSGQSASLGVPRHVSMDVSQVRGLAPAASDREFMRALGLTSSELTVAGTTDAGAKDLLPGDVLTAWNGKPLRDVFSLHEQLIANTAPQVQLTVVRHEQQTAVALALKGIETQRPEGAVTIYTLPVIFWGQMIEPEPLVERYSNPFRAVAYGVRQTAVQTHELFGNVISLVSGEIPLKALGGPMLIAKVAGDSARRGWQTFIASMALISVNLGLLNLFPIPVLDGGQLVLMLVEGLKRRPLSEAALENFQKVGFTMVLALVVLATYNDLSRFWRSMLESVVGKF